MAKRAQFRRLFALGCLLILSFAGLTYRLVDLQVLRHEQLNAKAQKNTFARTLLAPRRGDILDAKGNLLATSVFAKTVCADPVLISNRQAEVARVLAPLLQIPESALIQSLTPRPRQNARGEILTNRFIRFVRLKRKVPEETWWQIQDAMKRLSFGVDEKSLSRSEQAFYSELRSRAIFARTEQMRVYPNQSLAAHVLGYAQGREREINDTVVNELAGADGIEATFDEKLAGVCGWRVTETDERKRELVPLREQDVEPVDGFNVVLTIDAFIQSVAESALAEAMEKYAPESASAIVIRPATGEILAMSTLPNFDPNNLTAASAEGLRNRAIADIAEPGSTFKIVVVSGALNDGLVRLTDVFDCEHGRFSFAGHMLSDHESYGPLSVAQIISKSSNIGAAKIGIKMGANRLYNYISDFGFGTATGLPLPGEVSAARYVPPVSKWYKVSLAQIPMGQGICVTRLQMAMAMCAIANRGCLMRPMLVDRLEDRNQRVAAKYTPQRVRQVISETAATQMVQALKAVVSPEGTAAKAALEHYTVAGKTGTAQKVENGHYVHDKFFSSFIGFFPADRPELCIAVTLDNPDRRKGYYGGQTAAPTFKQIAERAAVYFAIRPEDADGDNLVVPANDHPLKTASAKPQ
jgi:cell division protein FtsI/penicillin-binding protein 2